jgi:hypothetical protein
LASKNAENMRQWLRSRRFPGGVSILDGSREKEVMVFVPSSCLGPKAGPNRTSPRQMAHLKRIAARDLGLYVNFKVTMDEADIEGMEAGLNALFRRGLPNRELHCFLSISLGGQVDLWVDEPSGGLISQKELEDLRAIAADYLEKANLFLHGVHLGGSSLPSTAIVLRSVKVVQPATLESVTGEISRQGFASVPPRWVKAQLDRLRRRGLVIWQRGAYSITSAGLLILPVSRGRLSSDVDRALALGKRRW